MRSGKTRGAVWLEVDLGAKLSTIPAERMKAAKGHCVPLLTGGLRRLGETARKFIKPDHWAAFLAV